MNTHAQTIVHGIVAGASDKVEVALNRGLAEKTIAALEIRKLVLVDEVFNKTVSPQK